MFQINLISVLKHLASTLSTLLDGQTISILIGTLCELICTADIHTTFSFFSLFFEGRSLGLLIGDVTVYVHFSISDILLIIMNFIHTKPKHSIQVEHDFFQIINIIYLLIHVIIASKADMEFHMNNRPLRLEGEVQTEIYLEQFCKCLPILFEYEQKDIETSSLLVTHAYEIVEHLLSNLDECLLSKYLNHALGKVIIWSIQENNRTLQQPFRICYSHLLTCAVENFLFRNFKHC
ncbi:unnamed protein product [Rotaria sp. Silwood2]|nr:unnamed protein product [Rotaria sp. Silwood2]CAF2959584.1 unnamed protein product [Rotaria sp. Silwood2]